MTTKLSRLWRSIGLVIVMSLAGASWPALPAGAATEDWATSLHDVQRTSASADTTFSTANAAAIAKKWSFQTGGPIAATPTVVGGVAYFGSWDGYEYAVDAVTGAQKWKTFIGITNGSAACIPPTLGVSSPATVTAGTVYVGGGDSYWYALNATTGAVQWRVFSGDNSAASGHYNWSGPLIVGNYGYIGVASLGDCPLVQGQVIKVNLTTHQIENTLNLVPNGQVGGGIWTTPAYDPATGTIYTATGTENSASQPYAQAFLAIDAATLAVKDRWRLPESEAVLDSDFSTSTTLFTDASGRQLISAINKNGDAYTFLRSNLAAGPIWRVNIARGGDCPTCGESSVSSSAFGGGRLYLAGSYGTINGQGYPGTVRAVNPATGAFLWQHPTTGTVIGALSYANGLVFVGAGKVVEVLDAATGATLYSYDTGSQIYAGLSVAGGQLFTGNVAGAVLSFNLGSVITPPADPTCPSGFTCQDVGTTTPAGSETVAGGTWTVKAGGGGLAGTADSVRLVTKPAVGNTRITAQITGEPTGANAQTGVIMRQNNQPGAPFYAVVAKPGNTLLVQQRSTFGGPVSTLTTTTRPAFPLYVMIQRTSNQLQAATSTNGTSYTLIPGADATISLPAASLAGVVASSGTNGTIGNATVASVAVAAAGTAPAPAAAAHACPSGWSCQDVGNPALVGDQTLTSGTWTVKGAGGDIWTDNDQFHWVYQSMSGDGTMSARVTSQTNTDPNAKAGVMLRTSAARDAAYYGAYLGPDGKVHVQFRDVNGFTSGEAANQTGAVPTYLRVARHGTTFTAYTSADGSSWTAVPSSDEDLDDLGGTLQAGLVVNSHNVTALGTATFANVALGAGSPVPPSQCPTTWTCEDIGFPTPKGSQSLTNGTWTVEAGGGDIWADYDTFRLISQSVDGDGSVSARVAAQSNTGPWAKAGPMLRFSNSPQSPYYAAFVTPANGVVVQWRGSQGGSTQQVSATGVAPSYLKVGRTGTNLTAFTSPDGSTWTAIPGSTQSLTALSGTLLGGMAADSYDTATSNVTTWDHVVISTAGGGTGGLPSPWTDADIGAPTPAGSASYANNTFSVKGGGTDIWGTADQSNYVWQPLTGDGQITARMTSQTNTDAWAKAGVMIKGAATAGSPYVATVVTPGNGIHFQANFNTDTAGPAYTFPNAWIRVVRAGNVFTSYASPDGTNYAQVGQTTLALPAAATVGLFVNAHNGGSALGTGTFDNVSVIQSGGGTLPAPWVSGDVGTPLLPGSASYSGGAFTVKGAGNEIWGAEDQFQFVSQSLTGDGQIVARTVSQDGTDPWAKSGVMIKASTTAGAPYSLLGVTPGNGLHMQSNFNTDTAGGSFAFPNAWLKLVRTGTSISTFSSADGSTWTPVATATVALGATAQIGLFVCAHNGSSALNTTVFDNVAVTPATVLPTGWSDTDVGAPAQAGTGSFGSGVFTLKGGGNDIWGTADQFHYTYRSLPADGQIIARITGQSVSDAWAKAGVIIKQSTAAGSNYAAFMVTPGNGLHLQSNFTSDQTLAPTVALPQWLKLVRTGSSIVASTSTDGTTWTPAGAPVTLAGSATIGLFDCSHNGGTLSTVTFDNVSTTP